MESNQTTKRKSKREQWRQIFSDWKHSECKTKVEFCQQSGISIKSFYRWRSVFAREGLAQASSLGFAKVLIVA